ncbi:pilus assembly protein TadG-related protein, partial [Mesorhizobium sp.]
MFGYTRDFVRSRRGSMMPVFIIILTPLLLAVGFSVDYTSAVETKSNMQN